MAASMQLDISNTDKLAQFRHEARTQGIEVLPPSVQKSEAGFSVEDGRILYALAAIKGVGEHAVAEIVAGRKANGPFRGLADFFARIDIRNANRRVFENLIAAGALDCFGETREAMIAGLDRLLGFANRTVADRASGQNDMFSASGAPEAIRLPPAKAWSPAERLHREFQAVGFYLSSHPLDEYRPLLARMRVQLWGEFEQAVRAGASAGRLAGTVASRQERRTRLGKKMGVVQLSDPSGQYEAVVFEEGLGRYRELLEPGKSVILLAGADLRPEGVSLRIQHVEALEEESRRQAVNLRIFLRDEKPVATLAPLLQPMARFKGEGRVSFVLIRNEGEKEIEVELRERYALTPPAAAAIKAIPGVLDVEMV
jgi:DNA polymerase-3 subunit alpha